MQAMGDYKGALDTLMRFKEAMIRDTDAGFKAQDLNDLEAQLRKEVEAQKTKEQVVTDPIVEAPDPTPIDATDKTPGEQTVRPIPTEDEGVPTGAIVLMGAGAAIVASGVLLSTGLFTDDNDSEQVDNHRLISASLIGGGALVAGAGAIWWLVADGDDDEMATTIWSPVISTNVVGASVITRF